MLWDPIYKCLGKNMAKMSSIKKILNFLFLLFFFKSGASVISVEPAAMMEAENVAYTPVHITR